MLGAVEAAVSQWAGHARRALDRAGHRSSAPRTAVVDAVAELGCSVTAREIAQLLAERGQAVGLASIYRALDLLERLGLVQRFEVGEGAARYEPVQPSGEHHHHLVCERCGEVSAFEDPALERAIERLSHRVDYAVGHHDVTLRGECPACHARA
jgi:Fur family transcriptional regulator, ferric uptake regulator